MTIEFRSDNSAGVAPEIMAAIADADQGSAVAYGADEWTERLQDVVRDVFEHPTARAFPVTSGTAGNALALTALCPPWGAVLCHETAHIIVNEGGATSLLGGGAVMKGVRGDDFLMQPRTVRSVLESTKWGDPHHSQPAVLSFTQPSDMGTVYQLDELVALVDLVRERDLKVHLDGARMANALDRLGCSPADMTWRAGVDVVTLGATKNGALSAEAIVAFDATAADELVYRTKRSGHVTSKMRYQSAQLIAYLTNGLWLRLAHTSNAAMARLVDGLRELDVEMVNRPDVNMVYVRVGDDTADLLEAKGMRFYRMGGGVIRLVTSWQTTDDDIDDTLAIIATATSP